MAPKVRPQLCFFIFLLSLALALVFPASASKTKGEPQKPSPFGFLKHLQGCHKGEKLNGIKDLKTYLEKFGYLNYDHSSNHSHADDNDFDDLLEAAVKTYQVNYHLKPTGILDAQTVSKMMMPRCRVADISNGTNWMQKKRGRHLRSFGTVAHFRFFEGNPKWPATQTHLTYGFQPGMSSQAAGIIARAYDKWAAVTHFTFSQVDYDSANMKVGFHGRGGDDSFDGPGGELAHAWPPTDGRAHYDVDENWSDGAAPGTFDLETVALHEIGHQLGLHHSEVEGAVMWSVIPAGVRKRLDQDDIQGIKALYGV